MTTVADLIAGARDATNDADPDGYRVSDAQFLLYFADGVREMVGLVPGIFGAVLEVTCEVGKTLQSAPAPSAHFLSIVNIKGGDVPTECDKSVLDAYRPSWHNDPPGPADNFCRHPADPNKFYITPPAPTGQILVCECAQVPTLPTAVTDAIPSQITDIKAPALMYYLVARAESKDDEFVLSGRASLFYQLFRATATGQLEIMRQLVARLANTPSGQEVT